MNSLLPQVPNRNRYKELFSENHHWLPAIHYLIKKYQLNGEIRRGELGSHIVYRVGNSWIKLMAPLFAKDMPFEISGLRAVAGNLSVATPAILAEGNLEGWSYVILSHVEGQPIRSVWPKLDSDQKITLAEQIAVITTEISRCKGDSVIESRFNWNEFIAQQYISCEEQQIKKELPEPWLLRTKQFLQQFNLAEFQTKHPVLLHADLTFDHFLVTDLENPKVSGVIDMADSQMGHFEYELVAPSIFIFKNEKQLLRRYLVGCGYSESDLNQRFSEKLIAWSLLHRYFSFITYFKVEMNELSAGDFPSLAKKVFPL